MRMLITAGPTREPIDPVRYIGNRSSGKMGAALVRAALAAGQEVTAILGPVATPFPSAAQRIDVETAEQMLAAVLREFPKHDLLIMAAAVADYRPVAASAAKLARKGVRMLELESTADIVAAAGRIKRPDQRTVGFSLETTPDPQRVRDKLRQKKLDLIVYNAVETISSELIQPTLFFADGSEEKLPSRPKGEFADILIQRSAGLFD
ncbi:MAG TPA: phosphopantothenoylcysteine decarboxylase [Tepidisphaeraceae bacterium]|jgi:phosphopantothenoylcysteine decarboxylase/phosphopantothenate--cysteine ligase|nr:phosphopantothenoylcysteine decarboxylase [Tepidisphaeraceae bacterium]